MVSYKEDKRQGVLLWQGDLRDFPAGCVILFLSHLL